MRPAPHPVLLAASLLAALAPARALTPAQAQSLPEATLARLVPGEVGTTVIAVDRPRWGPSCGGPICPPLSLDEIARRGPAPLANGITFYQRATPTPGGAQSIGLCTSVAITVAFTPRGAASRVSTDRRYGSAPGTAAPSAGQTIARRSWAAESAACAAIRSVHDFFTADDEGSAYRAALAGRQLAAAVRAHALPFAFGCRRFVPGRPANCADLSGAAEAAQALAVANIAAVKAVPCPGSPPHHACYAIDTRSPGAGATIEMTDAWATARLVRLDYRVDSVVY